MAKTLLAGVITLTALGCIVYFMRRSNTGKMLDRISDEGYETAHDILYPREVSRSKNQRYGPVLP